MQSCSLYFSRSKLVDCEIKDIDMSVRSLVQFEVKKKNSSVAVVNF
jgi:hypothetical protein